MAKSLRFSPTHSQLIWKVEFVPVRFSLQEFVEKISRFAFSDFFSSFLLFVELKLSCPRDESKIVDID